MRGVPRKITLRKLISWSMVSLVLVGMSYVFLQVRGSIRHATCGACLRQLGLSASMYTQDYDGSYPPFRQWMDKTFPYCKNWYVYHCTEVPASEGFGYGFNSDQQIRSKIANERTYPLIFDSRDIRKNAFGRYEITVADPPRHRGGSNWLVYADGHAKWLYPKP